MIDDKIFERGRREATDKNENGGTVLCFFTDYIHQIQKKAAAFIISVKPERPFSQTLKNKLMKKTAFIFYQFF